MPQPKKSTKRASPATPTVPAVLLSGGNPQIAKGYGHAPVQSYIDALSGWQQDVARKIDSLIIRTLPNVLKAVKWNSPMYGVEAHHYFLSMHAFKKYIKVAFFTGQSLRPMPPGESKTVSTRYLDIYETDALDEKQFIAWVQQASELPGVKM